MTVVVVVVAGNWEKVAASLCLADLGLRSGPATSWLCDPGQVPNVSEPDLSHPYNGDNDSAYFLGLLWELPEVMLTSFP